MIYLVLFVDRATRCIVSWALVAQRTFDTMQPLADAVWQHSPQHRPQHSAQHSAQHSPQHNSQTAPRRVFYSDQLETYGTLLYRYGQHLPQPNKSQTYSVEGCNADLRCYLSALIRRTRGFARSVESLRRLVWLWVFCYNRRCLALQHAWMRQWPPLLAQLQSTSSDEADIKKHKQRLRRRLLYRYPIISFLPALF
jgi:hypothetical protein